jgi:DNA anti-recombination protein RmuC
MSSPWAAVLAQPGSTVAQAFEAQLRQRLEDEFEADDELVQHIISQLGTFSTREQLHDDFTEVFDDAAESMSSWWVVGCAGRRVLGE